MNVGVLGMIYHCNTAISVLHQSIIQHSITISQLSCHRLFSNNESHFVTCRRIV
uniref:Uncharacterized protein n=1 Tax=Anguilla anguilla TaxID=7936 RepID=A0A0E9RKS0_ANGAN